MHRATSLLLILTVAGVACSSSGRSATTTSTPRATATSTTIGEDGVLRLGIELPLTGPGAPLGLSMKAGVDLAVARINASGGVLGKPIETRVTDEGADLASSTAALDDLANDGIDALVGPASSTDALGLLNTLRKDELVSCSPSATALALDDFPDDGWFFRTAPSESLEAQAMARAIDQTGRRTVSILYVDDSFGRPWGERLATALRSRGIGVSGMVPFPAAASDAIAVAARTAANNAEVVAVIGDAVSGPLAATAALASTGGTDVPVFVNDAMRGQPAAAVFAQLPAGQADRIEGVAPRALPDDQDFKVSLHTLAPDVSGAFAVNAFDCVNLLALAAQSASSTLSRRIANEMQSVADGGTRCTTFTECANDLAAGRNIDYDGPSGQLDLTTAGEVSRGLFDVFGVNHNGSERPISTITVSA